MSTPRPIEELRALSMRALGNTDRAMIDEIIGELAEYGTDYAASIIESIQGSWFMQTADTLNARTHHERSYQFATASNDPGRIAIATMHLGEVSGREGDHETAIELFTRAAETFRSIGDLNGAGYATISMANVLVMTDRLEEAQELLLRATADVAEVGDRTLKGRIMSTLGIIASRLESFDQAVMYYNQSLEHARAVDDRSMIAGAQMNLGSIYGDLGDNSTAIDHYLRCLETAKEADLPGIMFSSLANLGSSYMDLGDLPTAKQYFTEAGEVAKATRNLDGFAHNLANLGVVSLELKDLDTAAAQFAQARQLAKEAGSRGTEIMALVNLFECQIERGEISAAIDLEQELLNTTIHAPRVAADFMMVRGRLRHRQGATDEAVQTLKAGLEFVRERGIVVSQVALLEELCSVLRAAGKLEEYIEANDALQDVKERLRGTAQQRRVSVQEKQQEIEQRDRELERHRTALYATLPQHVAERVLKGKQVTDTVEDACVLFLDIAGFTALSSSVPAGHVVHLLEAIFGACDEVIHKHDLTKVKTIGDSYMAVAGVVEDTPDPAGRMAAAALDLMDAMNTLQVTMPPELGDTSWVESIPELKVRIGIDHGPVVAGIVGKDRLQYDVWGDTVNTASRMESTGEPGRIQVSSEFYEQLSSRDSLPVSDLRSPKFTERGEVNVKGKGTMTTYWLER